MADTRWWRPRTRRRLTWPSVRRRGSGWSTRLRRPCGTSRRTRLLHHWLTTTGSRLALSKTACLHWGRPLAFLTRQEPESRAACMGSLGRPLRSAIHWRHPRSERQPICSPVFFSRLRDRGRASPRLTPWPVPCRQKAMSPSSSGQHPPALQNRVGTTGRHPATTAGILAAWWLVVPPVPTRTP